ncbi:helicase SNF2 family protein [Actinomadura sp. NBRC 104425]|nr:helicase SNF2 family protein [Actinomadura sp. NBRC 104425]
MTAVVPELGDLVVVRGEHWVVSDVAPGEWTLVRLTSVADGGYGRELSVVWEVEPGRRVLERETLPKVDADRFDDPGRLAAFIDAVRWSAVTSADTDMLQAPFRSGVKVETYQLEPVARALKAPTANLLIADDVGLGKTIEAGLVALELKLRHRINSVVVVCPAALTFKWRDEMADKFGLDFKIVNSELLKEMLRTHGPAANPFRVYPQVIVSLSWLRGARAQSLVEEVIADRALGARPPFDLLIVDEAHHIAPAAPKGIRTVDSQQTRMMRRFARHFRHRVFLSATPHNGYPESFTALLEMIDPQRFVRGVQPPKKVQDEAVIRRTKSDIRNLDGSPRYPGRETRSLVVEYPEAERRVHGWLNEYTRRRRVRMRRSKAAAQAADLSALVLKKRFFSSPAAFAATIAVHRESLERLGTKAPAHEVPEWLQEFMTDDEDVFAEAEDEALTRSARLQPSLTPEEQELLEQMEQWALTHEAAADAKAKALIEHVAGICRPGGAWNDERVVIFTEYRETQRWLATLLQQAGLGRERLALLHGGMSIPDRERLRHAFQADPAQHPARILVATDAAGEGIDLQRYCHRVINYDIPFNPNKLEQRIGRIDRYGQRHVVQVWHFVGSGWRQAAPGSYEADLEFLSRVARKVARMEQDLGAVNAVLAAAVQDRMLGRARNVDIERRTSAEAMREDGRVDTAQALAPEEGVSAQVARLRAQLDRSVDELRITPANIHRVVSTALGLARQQPLEALSGSGDGDGGLYRVPTLTKSWAKVTEGLPHKVTGEIRPVTFDPELVDGSDDVVLAHLGHPLTAMSVGLLRAAMWGRTAGLHRVAAVVSDDDRLEAVAAAVYGRLVLVGADGSRLHEEIISGGVWLRPRFGRIEGVGFLDDVLSRALNRPRITAASPPIRARLAQQWPRLREPLLQSLQARAEARRSSLERRLTRRRDDEIKRVNANLDQLAASLRTMLATETDEGQQMLAVESGAERREWQRRLDGIDADRECETRLIRERYEVVRHHVFPAAVLFVVPEWEATR